MKVCTYFKRNLLIDLVRFQLGDFGVPFSRAHDFPARRLHGAIAENPEGHGAVDADRDFPGSGSTCLSAAVAIPESIPNQVLGDGPLKAGKGEDFTFGHPSGEMTFRTEPILDEEPNQITLQDGELPENRAHHLRRHRLHQGRAPFGRHHMDRGR